MPFAIPLWLYAAVMAAGEVAHYKAAEKVDNERGKAMAEERKHRMKLSAENEATAEASKQQFADTKAREAQRGAELGQQLQVEHGPAAEAPLGSRRLLDALSPGTGTTTVETVNDRFGKNKARLDERAKSLGGLDAYGSVMGDVTQALSRNAQNIDMNATSMRNWNQNVLPARLEYANQSGRQWSTAGDIMKLAASIMGPMALGGGVNHAAVASDMADKAAAAATAGAATSAPAAAGAGAGAASIVAPTPGEFGYVDPYLMWQQFQQNTMPFPLSLLRRRPQPQPFNPGMH